MFSLPKLPYDFSSLEPHIATHIMELHYEKHHQGYTNKLNTAIEETELEQQSIEAILSDLDAIPDSIRNAVRNNGGGYHNHLLFWENMTSEYKDPSEDLQQAIAKNFGSFDNFKEAFANAAKTVFGSGWAWLVRDTEGTLSVIATANQDSPLSQGFTPLLALDVWEHAYYLQYENRRPEYVEAFWNVVNWEAVENRLQAA